MEEKNGLSPGQSCFRLNCIKGGLLSQNNLCKIKEGSGIKEYSLPLCAILTACRMKSVTPQVNQTGKVRLLSKLLNQKVDTVCCMWPGGKTLTVQGLWVCKKTGSLVEMHLQALELLTFKYAYKTVLNQSKQKKKKEEKRLKQCCVVGCSHTHFYSLIYNSCQVTSTNTYPAAWPLLSLPLGEGETASEEQKERKEPRGHCTSFIWPSRGVDHHADCLWQIFDTSEEHVSALISELMVRVKQRLDNDTSTVL